MHWTQLIIALGMAWALGRGHELRIVAILAANFAATMALAGDVAAVATMDALALAMLFLIDTRRADVVGALFAAMIPIYWLGAWFGLQPWVAYVGADLLCYLQIMVAGHGDNGIRRLGRIGWSRAFGATPYFAAGGGQGRARISDLDNG